jgi:hypothetical protein
VVLRLPERNRSDLHVLDVHDVVLAAAAGGEPRAHPGLNEQRRLQRGGDQGAVAGWQVVVSWSVAGGGQLVVSGGWPVSGSGWSGGGSGGW